MKGEDWDLKEGSGWLAECEFSIWHLFLTSNHLSGGLTIPDTMPFTPVPLCSHLMILFCLLV